jgi:hypothetical protein
MKGQPSVGRRTFHEGKWKDGLTKSRGQRPAPPTHRPLQTGGDYSVLPTPFSRLRKQLVNVMRDGYVREGWGWDRARIATHLWLCAWGVLPKGDNFSPTFYKNALKNRKTTACAHSMQLACLHTHLLAWPVVLKRICNGGQP